MNEDTPPSGQDEREPHGPVQVDDPDDKLSHLTAENFEEWALRAIVSPFPKVARSHNRTEVNWEREPY